MSRGVEWMARKRPAVTAAALRKRGLFEQRLSPKRPPSSSPPPLGAKAPTASDSPPLPAETATTTSSSSSSSLTAQAGCNPNNAGLAVDAAMLNCSKPVKVESTGLTPALRALAGAEREGEIEEMAL
ncbi:hypothetical protein TeGR_g7898 [Tetraparma gracilis]|uniref:Uncharacterized protein n=1 Tax=Tetraparma gracilis TaxID=2962635 RepID=A0ABQ6N027_9STRA|nr:hypothetical protein TeGR_g7898 [Tetraparma gracilis]